MDSAFCVVERGNSMGNSREFDAGFGEFDVFSMLAEL